MKKILSLIIVGMLLTFTACSASKDSTENAEVEITTTDDIEAESTETEGTETIEKSDFEIILQENHPKWLDDTSIAYEVWEEEIDNGKIVIPGVWETIYHEDYILDITSLGDEPEFIAYLWFYFERCDKTVSFDEAIDILSEYVTYDIAKAVQENYYEHYSLIETNEENDQMYTKWYRLKDGIEPPIERLGSNFNVRILVDSSGNVKEAGFDNSAFSTIEDEWITDWECNIFKNITE